MTSRSAAAIEVKNLTKTYYAANQEKIALRGVNLTIPRGAIFGLLGPNGAGKSTLIYILAGLVIKASGNVTIWGFDQDVNPRMSRASIGVVHQELHFDPYLTPLQSMEVQAGLYGVPKSQRRSLDILSALGLGDKAHAYTRSLSGGMRRRLMVAKAMAHQPPILVLDEPTAGVDVALRRQLWRFVRQLNNDGVTVILTTHYLEEAEAMCARVAILNHGEIVAEEATADLINRIDKKSVQITSPDPRLVEKLIAAAPPGVSVSAKHAGVAELTYRRNATSFSELLACIRNADIHVDDLSTQDSHLEDVFLALTGSAST